MRPDQYDFIIVRRGEPGTAVRVEIDEAPIGLDAREIKKRFRKAIRNWVTKTDAGQRALRKTMRESPPFTIYEVIPYTHLNSLQDCFSSVGFYSVSVSAWGTDTTGWYFDDKLC